MPSPAPFSFPREQPSGHVRNLPFQFHEEQDADRHGQHYRPDYDDGPATPLRERRERLVDPKQGVNGEDGGRTDHAAMIRPLRTVSMQDLSAGKPGTCLRRTALVPRAYVGEGKSRGVTTSKVVR